MRAIRLPAVALSLLMLVACGGDSTFPAPTIESVSPAEISADGSFVVAGTHFFEMPGGAAHQIEVCGVTLQAALVAPTVATIVLPPGSRISVRNGDQLSSSLPTDGFVPGLSSVRVTRPDGQSVTLADAVTCVVPVVDPVDPVDPVEEDPVAPVISGFDSDSPVVLGAPVAFSWSISNPEDGVLECTLTPSSDAEPIELDCAASEYSYTYEAPGNHDATIAVSDSFGHEVSQSTSVVVTQPDAPTIVDFAGSSPVTLGEKTDFTWSINNPHGGHLTCSLTPFEGAAAIALESCVESEGTTEYQYPEAGTFTAQLTVSDEHGNDAVESIDVVIELPAPPAISQFGYDSPAIVNQPVQFNWSVSNPHGDPLSCSLTTQKNAAPIELGDCSESAGTAAAAYEEVDEYEVTLTVADVHGNQATSTISVVVVLPPEPTIPYFEGSPTRSDSLEARFSWRVQMSDFTDAVCTLAPGDGSVIELDDCVQDYRHEYPDADDYEATLTATDRFGRSVAVSTTVTIAEAFTLNIDLTLEGVTGTEFQLPLDWGNTELSIDWGDGKGRQVLRNGSGPTYSYDEPGEYTIRVRGAMSGKRQFGTDGIISTYTNAAAVVSLANWGTLDIRNLRGAFKGASHLTSVPDHLPPNVTDTSHMFSEATIFNGDIGGWNMSKVTDMSKMFEDALQFNQDLDDWDVSSATDINNMFAGASLFNGSIGNWDTSNVTYMHTLFSRATRFNQDISDWDTSNVTDMGSMFNDASSFNQDISGWDTGNVENMSFMFSGASSFDQDISGWETGKVRNMNSMLSQATSIRNLDLSGWCVTLIERRPNAFASGDNVTEPVWGTCPN